MIPFLVVGMASLRLGDDIELAATRSQERPWLRQQVGVSRLAQTSASAANHLRAAIAGLSGYAFNLRQIAEITCKSAGRIFAA
jgi:hypothetical protein